MTKLRKQRRRKTFKHNINRKRLRNKIYGVGKIQCKEIKEAWEMKKSIRQNMEEMGLSYDPNQTFKIPSLKQKYKDALATESDEEWKEEAIENEEPDRPKSYVAEALEAEAKAPREKRFRLPKSQVQWITYLLDKYGNDYKAMARDRKNYNQETWKQIRKKIRKFKNIPVQYNKYLEERGLSAEQCEDRDTSDGEL